LTERFDSTVGGHTVHMPFSGIWQMTPAEAMIAKIPVYGGTTDTATAMSFGFIPGLARWSPFHGGAFAVTEALSKLAAVGADPLRARLSMQEYYEALRDDPLKWGKPAAALLGALSAQLNLGVPAIGGKDSMSGTFQYQYASGGDDAPDANRAAETRPTEMRPTETRTAEIHVPPTLVCFAVCAAQASRAVSADFKQPGSYAVFLPLPVDPASHLPAWERVKALYERIHALCQAGRVLAASVVREGGLAAAVTRMCLGNQIGLAFDTVPDFQTLFAPLSSSLIIELKDDPHELLEGLNYTILGRTQAHPFITFSTFNETFNRDIPASSTSGDAGDPGRAVSLEEAAQAWSRPLEKIFPTRPAFASAPEPAAESSPTEPSSTEPSPTESPIKSPMPPSVPLHNERLRRRAPVSTRFAHPRVFIPVFPGINCELETAAAFESAGAVCDVFVLNNLTPRSIQMSLNAMAQKISQAQILMIPGGFSGGDEPDGSGKFIATVFRNPLLKEQITDLIERRDGLVLGICNGFQALIKLGLLPFGKITDLKPEDPTLTFNAIGRHVSRMVRTRITSVLSPWLARCEPGECHVLPVSHGEGRFAANPQLIQALADAGQIAAQYVDLNGEPSEDIQWNPNGSACAIEGVSSPDGRILGKMAHSERVVDPHACSNVPGGKNQRLFESGVAYYD
jgi:phosphoribosylformylglycinamidine synthase